MIKATAVFNFYWVVGDRYCEPYFDVIDPGNTLGMGKSFNHSTVTIETLNKLGIEVPIYPTAEEWKKTH